MYTTATKVKAYVDTGSMTDEDIEAFITSVSKEMDRMANQKLGVDLPASGDPTPSKYYDGNLRGSINIDPCYDIESVELGDKYGENFVVETQYVKYPAVAPYTALYLKGGYFPFGNQNVKVTADFGLFDTIPEDLSFACTVLTAGIILNKNASGEIKSEKIGNYSVSYDTETGGQDFKRAIDIINSYRKLDF